ncbi:MAG: YqfO family protein [Armatimonadota bacterium]|jgi:hypothetical protein
MSQDRDEVELLKLVVFVPPSHAEGVRKALGEAGAGRIGDYDFCSFSSRGIGCYRPLPGAEPYAGEMGKLASVEEERIETRCTRETIRAALEAVRAVHPYEEPAIDVYPLHSVHEFD